MAGINEPTCEIRAQYPRWAKNRAFVNGEDAVKACGRLYLPPVRPDDTEAEYQAHLARTSFYPAVNKIAQGLVGLIFRKSAQLATSSARVLALSQLISPSGQSLDDLAEEVVLETLITNFSGLLVDHPDAGDFKGLSAANQDQLGFRPRIALYTAESILEVTYGLVNNARDLVRVRLLEKDGFSVRELLLNDAGDYQVNYHQADENGAFVYPVRVTIPKRHGSPLRAIPFVLVSTSDKPCPQPALLAPSVDLNLNHYNVEGLLTSALFFTAGPTIVIRGFERKKDELGHAVVPVWDLSPGSVWEFAEPSTQVDFLQFDPKGAELTTNKLQDIKDALATNGHSILAPEKPAPESPETQIIRRGAENATLAAFTRTVSRKLEKALRIFAEWADPAAGELAYSLNTDFLPQAMSPQAQTAMLAAVTAGQISWQTYILALRDGGVVSPALDPDTERALIDGDLADRPPVGL
jgi:hypothetical protein